MMYYNIIIIYMCILYIYTCMREKPSEIYMIMVNLAFTRSLIT